MNDPFVRSLRSDWQSQTTDVSAVLNRLRRDRWVPHVVLGAEILVCVLAFLVGLWFAWVATHYSEHRALFMASAVILLITSPVLGFASVKARRPAFAWDVESPESVLAVGLRRAESSLRALRIARWHIAVVLIFVAALWVMEALGIIHAPGFLALYTTVCVVACAVSWMWMAWREKRVRSEHAACARLLETLGSAAAAETTTTP